MDRKRLLLLAVGAVLLLAWFLVLRPVDFEYADGHSSDGPKPDALPWNTILRSPIHWEYNGTSAVLGACTHSSCLISLRTDEPPDTPWGGVLYWRAPWAGDGSVPVDLPPEFEEAETSLVPHRVSTATYHVRDPALDLGVVAVGALTLRLGVGGDRARSAAVAWAATVPFAPFVMPLSYAVFTPLAPSLVLAALALGVRWTWQRPRVRRATSTLLEVAAVLLVMGLSLEPYFTPPPVA